MPTKYPTYYSNCHFSVNFEQQDWSFRQNDCSKRTETHEYRTISKNNTPKI